MNHGLAAALVIIEDIDHRCVLNFFSSCFTVKLMTISAGYQLFLHFLDCVVSQMDGTIISGLVMTRKP
jgi:hypothetical protein